jgi:hypothetical protein
MDKARRPHMVRTWSVERTRVPHRLFEPANLRYTPRKRSFHGRTKPTHVPTPAAQ